MKKNFVLLLLAIVCTGATHCRKKNDTVKKPEAEEESYGPEPPPNPPEDAPHTGKILSALRYEWGESSSEYMQFEYGADKKLMRVDCARDELYTYDATGRLTRIKIDGGDHTEQYDITYKTSGEPAYSIMTKTNGNMVFFKDSLTYFVRNGYVTKISIWNLLENHKSNDWEFTYANNNLLRMEFIRSSNNERQITVFEYGDKRSPFLACRPKFIFEVSYTLMRYSVNELKSESFIYAGTRTDWPITVTYDGEGNPTLASQKNGGFNNTWSYVY